MTTTTRRTLALCLVAISCGKEHEAAREPRPPARTEPATAGADRAHYAIAPAPLPYDEAPGNTEAYAHHDPNKMIATAEDALSTFSIDVDTASYAIARKKLLAGEPLPPDAVRVEEFLNYFGYGYDGPAGEDPFAVHLDVAPSPFSPGRHLLRIGVQARRVAAGQRKPVHLVFLVDVSGSMQAADKLPLAQDSLRLLVDNLRADDTVALVTYAGGTRVVLEATPVERKGEILAAIDDLRAGGGTGMASGMELAYREAGKLLSPGSETRVIVLSDGDANIGTASWEEILASVAGYVKEGVTMTTVGFGMGNYKDTLMEQLADKGNGNYTYIDSLAQARRVFQDQIGSTLEVVAQDVKIQVELDPAAVTRYRLVGYENRDIADRDFRNDATDAGEVGAGHSVTALYELELAPEARAPLATVRIRAKRPRGSEAPEGAVEWAFPMAPSAQHASFDDAPASMRFAVAVMGAAEILRQSPYAQGWSLGEVARIARAASQPGDAERSEFLTVIASPAARAR